jgi:hypothetical protein
VTSVIHSKIGQSEQLNREIDCGGGLPPVVNFLSDEKKQQVSAGAFCLSCERNDAELYNAGSGASFRKVARCDR